VAAGATVDDDALLVLRDVARPLSSFDEGDVDPVLLRGAWVALARLEELGIAHGRIDAETTVVLNGEVGFVDFADAVAGAGVTEVSSARAQLLITTAALGGGEAALENAIEALGREGVTELIPYLQSAALGAPLRRSLNAAGIDTDEFGQETAHALGVEPPDLVKLRRVSWRTVIRSDCSPSPPTRCSVPPVGSTGRSSRPPSATPPSRGSWRAS
jgi:hypothetical protein